MTRELAVFAALAGAALLAAAAALPVDVAPIDAVRAGSGATEAASSGEIALKLDGAKPADFPETWARPLFWQARRPAPAVPGPVARAVPRPAQPAAPPRLDFRLAGLMRTGDKPRALIVSPERPAGQWVEEGGVVGGWRLARIRASGVDLEAGGERHELKMD